jgi:site-specific recombinase XerC
MIESGYDIRTVQELLGARERRDHTGIHARLNRNGRGVKCPLDRE